MAEYLINGETLTSIANAIREKTNKTNTMKPTEFSDEISAINVGSNWETVKCGSFFSFNGSMSVAHNLGKLPDIVVVYAKDISEFGNDNIIFAKGFSSNAKSKFNMTEYINIVSTPLGCTGSSLSINAPNVDIYGIIHADNEYFSVGSSTKYQLKDGIEYMWIAISDMA